MRNYIKLKDWYRHINKASYKWLLCLLPVLVVMVITACQQTKVSNPVSEAKALIPDPSEPLQFETKPVVYKPEEGKENYRYGFIDRTGKFVIPPKFLKASCFRGGLAPVITDVGQAYIDKRGRFVTKPGEYINSSGGVCDSAWPDFYAEGLYGVFKNLKIPDASTGSAPSTPQIDIASGYVNAQGKLVIPLARYYADDFSDGMAQITVYTDISQEEREEADRRNDETVNERHGYVNKTGKVVISPKFDRAEAFRWGVAKVGIKRLELDPSDSSDPKEKKAFFYYGFIDKQGRYLIEPTSKIDGSGNDCDVVGKLVKKSLCRPDSLDEFRDGFAKLDVALPPSDTNVDQLLVNRAGKKLFPGQSSSSSTYYQRVEYVINEGLALIERDDGMKCFIDNQGNFVIPCKFKEAKVFTEGLAAVAIDVGPKKPGPPKNEIPTQIFIREESQVEPKR